METALIKSKSKPDFMLLLDIAKKFGVETTILTEDEIEDIGLGKAIQAGLSSGYINEKEFLRKLKKRAK